MTSKSELRAEIRERIARMSAADRSRESQTICERLRAHPRIASARRLGIYSPLPDEPDLLPLYPTLSCHLAMPVCEDGIWRFREITALTQRSPGPFGIRLPQLGDAVEPSALDVILVPGRAFTPSGQRLGRGAGIYDRLLLNTYAWRIGISFACQFFATVPAEAHDICMDEIVAGPM